MVSGVGSGFKRLHTQADSIANLAANAPNGRPCSRYRHPVTEIS
jgi:hypothetical protein